VQSFADRIRARAAELSFDAIGFADASVPLDEDYARFRKFIAEDMHGDMGYLADHGDARRAVDGEAILPGARTIICLARRYDRGEEAEQSDPPLSQLVARYARGGDYHTFLRKRIGKLAEFVRALADDVDARALCDTAPVLERAWAARAGLGFIGKNGLLIVPGQGSYCLLGEVVTTLAVDVPDLGRPMGERCGSCTACLDACPTDAFTAPFVLDPRRCVSYATIEARSGPPAELHQAMGAHLFGCDDCQTACPYNSVAPPSEASTASFRPHSLWNDATLEGLVSLDEDGWRALTGTPIRRATRPGLARNALLVAAKKGEKGRAALDVGREHDHESVRELAETLSGLDISPR
jgi:epoxyqueuosine reductase